MKYYPYPITSLDTAACSLNQLQYYRPINDVGRIIDGPPLSKADCQTLCEDLENLSARERELLEVKRG